MIRAHPHARKNACLAPEAGRRGFPRRDHIALSLFLSLHLNRQDRRQQKEQKQEAATAFQQLEPRT